MSIGLAVEITSNFIQLFMFIGFLYLFFDKPESKALRVIPFVVTSLIMLAVAAFFTVHNMTYHYLYYVVTVFILILYSVIFLRGRLFMRIVIPMAVSNILIAYLTVSVMSAFGALPFADVIGHSRAVRCMILFAANAGYCAFLFIIYRFGKGKINMRRRSDVLAFFVIPLLTCIVGMSALLTFEASGFQTDIEIYMILITVSTAVIVMIFWYLLIKLGKESDVKADLMLSKQREELYKSSVLSTNEQIEKISSVKHDMKNDLMSVSVLISNGEYEKAKEICDSVSERLTAAYTPVNTDNPTLNAIVNVELDKAQARDISFGYDVTNPLSFMSDGDIISVIANLCDNAIEYLANIPKEQRKMSLNISTYKSFCRIVCKNSVESSVLADNPDLKTTKKDKALHGKGVKILRKTAEKYNGELIIGEEDGQLSVSVVVSL